MDIVYYIPPRTVADGFGFRMSLRSVLRYGKNLGRIIAAGSPADWLCGDVVKFHTTPIFAKSGVNENILSTIIKLIQEGVVQSEFLLVYDDVFLAREVDLNDFPFYVKGPKIQTVNDLVRYSGGAVITKNKIRMSDTRMLLERNGYMAVDYSGRTFVHIDPSDACDVEKMWLQEPHGEWGYDVASLFLNVRGRRDNITISETGDVFFDKFKNHALMEEKIGTNVVFSASSQLIRDSKDFRDELINLFPRKSQFEN